jgi:hypothetical protein
MRVAQLGEFRIETQTLLRVRARFLKRNGQCAETKLDQGEANSEGFSDMFTRAHRHPCEQTAHSSSVLSSCALARNSATRL